MKCFLLLFLVSFTVFQSFAVPLENLISSNHLEKLNAGEIIIRTRFEDTSFEISPRNGTLDHVIAAAKNSFNPNIVIETLYLYKKPEKYFSGSRSWNEGQRIGVFNQTLAVSTLSGIQYYSASRRELRTFYESSVVIDDPRTKKPLPDPVFTQPVSTSLFARQKDLTFGDNIYRYDYTASEDILIFTQENVTALSVGIFRVIGKGNLKSIFAVTDCGDSILIYAVSMVNAALFPGMKERITSSFSSRAEAILKWFSGRLDSELYN